MTPARWKPRRALKNSLGQTDMANHSSRVAKTSLWMALAGFVVPVAALFVDSHYAVRGQRVCLGLFVLSELIALACGFTTRSNPLGKAGLTLSILLLLAVFGTLFVHLHVR